MRKNVVLTFLFLLSTPAIAMDWASGGGELIQDSQNPWFVQNTTEVTYCSVIDSSAFQQSPTIAKQAIERAIAFWKQELPLGETPFTPRIEVGTQTFREVSCDISSRDADIVFQFGYLDEVQRAYVRDPSRYAGLSVRTTYDRAQLKGRGFVYIGADSGPNRFGDSSTVSSPWTYQDGALLYWTLVHELGHVFGLSHTRQHGEAGNVMASDFVENLTNRMTARYFRNDRNMNGVFRVRGNFIPMMDCRSGPTPYWDHLKDFFGIDRSWKCFGTKVLEDSVEVYAQPEWNTSVQPTLIGTAAINTSEGRTQTHTLLTEAVNFWLPPEQTVYPSGTPRVHAPVFRVTDIVATFRSTDGAITRQMSYTLDPRKSDPNQDDLKIGGVMGDRLFVNFKEGI